MYWFYNNDKNRINNMDGKVEISKEKFEKLKSLAMQMNKINSNKDLNYIQIRRLQYLIKKNYEGSNKTKLFSLVNLYKHSGDKFLLQYLLNLYEMLEDGMNLPKGFKKPNE